VSRLTLALRWLRLAVMILLFVGWAMTLRPVLLGGPATYLVVRGTSMLPIYETGDLVILHDQPSYGVGDVVGYRVPAHEVGAGRIVLHRIIGLAPGGFVLQGDNNEAPDPWTPSPADVAGSIWIVVPVVGRLILWLYQPVVLAAGGAAIAVAMVVGHQSREPARGAAGATAPYLNAGTRTTLRRPVRQRREGHDRVRAHARLFRTND
jgi:signal peptidase